MDGRRTFVALFVLKHFESSESCTAGENLVGELCLVGLAVGVGRLVGVLRITF